MKMNMKHMILWLVASLCLAACQDDALPEVPQSDDTEKTVTAYLQVNLATTDGSPLTRATEGDPIYQDGQQEGPYLNLLDEKKGTYQYIYERENDIICADFYLFTKDGSFSAFVRRNLQQLSTEEEEDDDNIESIVVPVSLHTTIKTENLQGSLLDAVGAKYLVVVLNDMDNKFYKQMYGKSLNDIAESTTLQASDLTYTAEAGKTDGFAGELQKKYTYLKMANSSYMNGAQTGAPTKDGHFWATELQEENFKASLLEAKANPVTVYVERRMVKLSIAFDESINKLTDEVNFSWGTGHEGYSLDPQPAILLDVTYGNTPKQIVMQFYEWGCSGSEKENYPMKRIEGDWSSKNDWLTNSWNKPDKYRSYWGKGLHYEIYNADNYASSFEAWATGKGKDKYQNNEKNQNLGDDYVLNYYSLKDIDGAIGVHYELPKYTCENTPSQAHIDDMSNRINMLHWLLSARVFGYYEDWEDAKGNEYKKEKMPKPLGETTNGIINTTFFRWDNRLWSEKDLVAQLLNSYQAQHGGFNAYTRTEENGKEIYTQIGLEHFRLVDHFDGKVKLALNDDNTRKVFTPGKDKDTGNVGYYIATSINEVKSGQEWYYKKSDGTYEQYVIANDTTLTLGSFAEGETDIKTIAQQIKEFNTTTVIPMAINGYNDGFMYYSIPVEHIGTGGGTQEGDYGAVGNHWYQLTINKVLNIGYGIFDPYEDIVPNDDNPSFYGLSFKMQVAPWHVQEYEITLDGTK